MLFDYWTSFHVQVLQSLPWFSDTRATCTMAASAMSGEGSFGTAEVHTALQAAHKLVWDHELQHGTHQPFQPELYIMQVG